MTEQDDRALARTRLAAELHRGDHFDQAEAIEALIVAVLNERFPPNDEPSYDESNFHQHSGKFAEND